MDPKYERTTGGAFFSRGGDKNKNNKNTKRSVIKCFSCGKRGHKANECRTHTDKGDKNVDKKKKPVAFSAMYLSKNTRSSDWYIDSGASQHMTPHAKKLTHTKPATVSEIVSANNQKLAVTAVGSTSILVNGETVPVNNVLCVPELSANLLSIAQLVSNDGNEIVFNNNGCTIFDSQRNEIVNVKPKGGVYKLNTETSCMLASINSSAAMDWHRRLGHLNYDDMRRMRDGAVDGVMFDENGADAVKNCTTCMLGKHTRSSFKKSLSQAAAPLDLIHSDLCGPMEEVSLGGARYFLTLIDDHTRKVFVYFLAQKSEVLAHFKEFKAFVEVQLERKIKAIRSDNGTEYCNKEFEKLCRSNGIVHQKSVAYTPQQNGVAERMNRTLVERAKCMLADASLKKSYWAEALNMAAYIVNRSINSAIGRKIPEEVWSGKRVNLKDLRIFGSAIMVFVPKEKRKKWDAKSNRMLFVGYTEGSKSYRCIDAISKKICCSRDVKFLKSFENQSEETNTNQVRDFSEDTSDSDTSVMNITGDYGSAVSGDEIEIIESNESSEEVIQNESDRTYVPDETLSSPENEQLRRSERVPKPITGHVKYAATKNNIDDDPLTVAEAMDSDIANKWTSAINDELQSLAENNT